ncbi:MAG: aminotransferase class I/II-fold pyridoxal phosphate-dependent enzyme [Oscillospiraceae bacterium]|nr:aminotransferase class I/II-fold pyridoxal phosphate-dependent enzyme [Oscillospiraceae bacterium]
MEKKPLSELAPAALEAMLQETKAAYDAFQAKKLSLNMARGKPGPEQLDLTMPLLDALPSGASAISESGDDCRNYGLLSGIAEAKKLFADILGADPAEMFVGGSSSLELMFACLQIAYVKGIAGCTPWSKLDEVKFLCPVPGYDRHFALTEYFGVKMITVPTDENGPDMEIVRKYVENDDTVKGIWCVPVYANPSGIVYSDETVRAFAALKPAAKDFRIFWDNAYCIHHLVENPKKPLTINQACAEAGSNGIFYQFVSTSKVTFPGAGVAAFNTSKANLEELQKHLGIQTIGFDKMNMLRHVRFFHGSADEMRAHMEKHRAVLAPKFAVVLDMLEKEIAPLGIGKWTKPEGGYFVSFFAPNGTAKRIVQLCKEGGVTLTGAGATYPYKNDPDDSNIRIAPTYPSPAELEQAMELFCICVKLAALEQLVK